MSSFESFQIEDLFEINSTNLDHLTENFNLLFYFHYLTEWPDMFIKSVQTNYEFGNTKEIGGYIMGKTDGSIDKNNNHTHITAITIQNSYRKIGLASELCSCLESLSNLKSYESYFIDLFVRVTNKIGIKLYLKLGYSIWLRVIGYYGNKNSYDKNILDNNIDAFEMRKPLNRDINKTSIRENGHLVYLTPDELPFL